MLMPTEDGRERGHVHSERERVPDHCSRVLGAVQMQMKDGFSS